MKLAFCPRHILLNIAIQFPYRLRFDVRLKCCAHDGHRDRVPPTSCSSYFDIQFPVVFRIYHVRDLLLQRLFPTHVLSSAAWATFGSFKIANSWAWRLPSLLQGLPSILQVCLVWFAPESPRCVNSQFHMGCGSHSATCRWLVSKGRDIQALKTLAYYHAGGNESVFYC